MFVETTALKKILKLDKRIRFVNGGTSSSKTISILMWLIDYAQSTKGDIISVVGESVPFLKRGAIRDFKNIMEQRGYFKEGRWNRTDFIYTFETGSIIEFFSADNSDKVRGPRRDVLYLNEGNNNSYETYTQLEIRTRKLVFIDSNPTHEYWAYTEVLAKQDIDFLTLTYKDNEGLEQAIIDAIEARKGNKAWYQVYGLGQLGEVEGKIYKGWQIIDDIPHEARRVSRGLDFGYSRDPAVLVDIFFYNGGFILDELFYRTGMTNSDIGNYINNSEAPQTLVIADGAEPKSIDALKMMGVAITSSEKGQGVVNRRIDHVKSQRMSLTKRSTNLIKSYRNYMWKTDKDGNILNIPDHFWSDGMDAAGYGLESQRPRVEEEPVLEPSMFTDGFYI